MSRFSRLPPLVVTVTCADPAHAIVVGLNVAVALQASLEALA
jgi:hypothetical protein